MQRFETLDVNLLKDSLQTFIQEASEKCQCECVVLDCHGGPDNSSFAACLFADYSLMVSEPDRITFYGTLNFLRQLKRIGGEQQVNLHLVFNKVVPAFSGLFLRSLYNRLIREHFSGRPLLAIFPLEVYLTKEFEKTPFLTGVYPYSWLAKKARTLLCDLMLKDHADKLPPSIRAIPKWVRAYTRLSLGKQFPLFNMNVVMLTVVGVVVFLALVALSLSQFFPTQRQRFQSEVARIRTLQCLSKSRALADDAEGVSKLIEMPDGYNTFLSNTIRERTTEANRTDDDIEKLKDLLLFERARKGTGTNRSLEEAQKKLSAQKQELREILDFKTCAYPSTSFDYDEDYARYRLLSSRNSDSTVIEPLFISAKADSPYGVFTRRREVLNGLKPESVPKDYLRLYERSVQNLKNMSLLYLALQTISEVVFSASGSRALAIVGGGWLGIVLLFTWSGQLDRRFTYYSRLRRFASLMGPYVVAMVLWFLPLLGVATIIKKLAPFLHENPTNRELQLEIFLLIAVPIIILATGQIIHLYGNLRYDRHYLEGLLRAIFLVYFMFDPLVMYLLFMRQS
jgi:hypothetical protein